MTNSQPNPEFENLLDYIKHSRGFDFTGYKRPSLMRRVQKRMQAIGIDSFSEYLDYLEVAPEEFVQLFNTILINVTSFFRDRPTWDYIASEVIPCIAESKEATSPIRVWSAGCASGQEAYTLAIVLAEVLGIEQFKARVKIYGTDVDEEALNQARLATYNAKEVESLPHELLEQYFEPNSDKLYTFRKDLRRSVIFGRHDLLQDAPISRIDLLTCRNALMYFNSEAQARIIARFHFALNDSGFLLLGKAEMLLSHANSFTPIDLNRRIFTKVPKVNLRDRLLLMGNNNTDENSPFDTRGRIRDSALDANPVAQIVVDINGLLNLANQRARTLFNINPKDLSRPLQDLELSYRPLELRSGIEQAYSDYRPVNHKEIEWSVSSGETLYFDVQIAPLIDLNGKLIGASITYTDVTRSKRLQEELQHSNQELEMAYEELQSTNEELETTNEELQSSNEELETTNEELQSTNEELETMNEELQSSNEELQTINEEVRLRSDELNQANSFLESILTSLRGGVVVINREMQVQIWNDKAEDFWGLRATEVLGEHFLNLDIGLPVQDLRQPIRNCLMGESENTQVSLAAINRRGKAVVCKVTSTPLMGKAKKIQGVILLMELEENE